MDAWVYQQIIHETQPTIIIEIGNGFGGSALFLADMQSLSGNGTVIGVDIDHSSIDFQDSRIQWVTGDATKPSTWLKVKESIKPDDRVMIIEDSSHTLKNTLAILRMYWRLVTPGCYFIVEDGVCRRRLIDGPKPGPYEAIHAFLKENKEFAIDKGREKFVLTFNPDGYLKRRE